MPSLSLILPASSPSGFEAAKALLQAGHPVRAAARDVSKLSALSGAKTVQADLHKPETIKAALQGVDSVFFINPTNWGPVSSFEEAEKIGATIRQALKESQVKRVVFLSSIGAEKERGTGTVVTLHTIEELLKDLPQEVVFLRASLFFENWTLLAKGALNPPYVLPSTYLPIDRELPHVAYQDIGAAAAKFLTLPSSALSKDGPTIVEVTGPKDYSPIQVGKAFEYLNGGNKVQIIEIKDEELEGALAQQIPPNKIKQYSEMIRGANAGVFQWAEGGKGVVREIGVVELEQALKEIKEKLAAVVN